MAHINTIMLETLDPLQFAYRLNRSTDDGISITLHIALSHLDKRNTYAVHGPPEWHSGLRHCITVASCATRDLGSSPGYVTACCDLETHGVAHNWPSVVRVRGGFGRAGMFLSHCDSCGRPDAMQADTVARSTAFPPAHWCGWLPG